MSVTHANIKFWRTFGRNDFISQYVQVAARCYIAIATKRRYGVSTGKAKRKIIIL